MEMCQNFRFSFINGIGREGNGFWGVLLISSECRIRIN